MEYTRVFKPKEKELGKMYRVCTGLARGRSPAVLPAAKPTLPGVSICLEKAFILNLGTEGQA